MEDENRYIEDSTISFPGLADDLNKIGQLWNCHTSEPVGCNLFFNKLKEEHFKVNAIDAVSYTVTPEKITADKISKLNFTRNEKVELLCGLFDEYFGDIFEAPSRSHLGEERLCCQYNVQTYSVELLPFAEELMKDYVRQQLQNITGATHVISKVILGAEFKALILLKKKSNSGENICRKLHYGEVTSVLKATLQKLDSAESQNYEKSITLYSKPPIRNSPNTITEMFEQLENVHKYIENENHFRMIKNANVVGVPLQIVLVPIAGYLDIQVERVYVTLQRDVFDHFQEMLLFLRDFQCHGYVTRAIVDREPNLYGILSDLNSPLSIDVQKYEKKLMSKASMVLKEFCSAFQKFKSGLAAADTILEINEAFRTCGMVSGVNFKIEQFLAQGQHELVKIHHLNLDINSSGSSSKEKISSDIDSKTETQPFPLPDLFHDLDELYHYLEKMHNCDVVPSAFANVLADSIAKNNYLKIGLQTANSLKTPHEWDLETIKIIQQNLLQLKNKNTGKLSLPEDYGTFISNSRSSIAAASFLQITEMFDKPAVTFEGLNNSYMKLVAYVLQQIKMLGCHVLQPEFIESFLSQTGDKCNSEWDDEPDFEMDECPVDSVPPLASENHNLLSRLNIIVTLFSTMDCTSAQHTLQVMSLFPQALPLVIPDIWQEKHFWVLLPWLLSCTIKWESSPGLINENWLFTSSFQMIAAIRLGSNRHGKSTILNHLFTNEYMFSSCGEPGSKRGAPVYLKGMVEMAFLTKETCKPSLWTILQEHYREKPDTLLLLANLHGDALEYKETLQFLNQMVSCYIVFVMPGDAIEMKRKWEDMKTVVDKQIVFLKVDPKNGNSDNPQVIHTELLSEDSTIEKIRVALKNATSNDSEHFEMHSVRLGASLKMAEKVETAESQAFLKFVAQSSCKFIKNIMELQRLQPSEKKNWRILQNNTDLQEMLKLFMEMMSLQLKQRRIGLMHVHQVLTQYYQNESKEAYQELSELKFQYKKKLTMIECEASTEIEQLKKGVRSAVEKIDNISLGLEHVFREIGHVYEMALLHPPTNLIPKILEIPKLHAELFSAGIAVELLDGDSAAIPGAWFNAVGEHIHKLFPNLRIYVISILGLQSSGKSTLLNALFACKFAVSVGRCTKGLFMRLLFLSETLRQRLKVDAFLLIDTEGLGAPEKLNEKNAEMADRQLATFAMGMSDLTLINVLGESMSDLTEILQIAVVAIARLAQADIQPDILMIQHLTETNQARTSKATDQFIKALQNALELTKDKDVEIGIQSSACLKNLITRLVIGDVLKLFHPYKDGASTHAPPSREYYEDVVTLFETTIKYCQNRNGRMTFKKWYELIPSYWRAVSKENFAVRFKNIKEIYDFIDRGERIAKVKEAVDRTLLEHADQLKVQLRQVAQNAQWQAGKCKPQASDQNLCNDFIAMAIDTLKKVPDMCQNITGQEQECEHCHELKRLLENLYDSIQDTEVVMDVQKTIHDYISNACKEKVKVLTRMFDAEVVREGCSTEFMLKINLELRRELENPSCKDMSNHEQIKQRIWEKLLDLASKKNSENPLNTNMELDVMDEYQDVTNFVSDFSKQKLPVLGSLYACETQERVNPPKEELGPELASVIKTDLQNIAVQAQHIALKESREDKLCKLVENLQWDVQNALKKLEAAHDISFLDQFKKECHKYSLWKFYEDENVRKKLDTQNYLRRFKSVANFIKEVFKGKSECPKLCNCPAFTKHQRSPEYIKNKLDQKVLQILQKNLNDISEKKLNELKDDTHYQVGMIANMKSRVTNLLQEVQKEFKVDLLTDFKFQCHLYALIKFSGALNEAQNKWEENHNPLTILKTRKTDYFNLIGTRLTYGFTCDGEGRIIGDSLLRAVNQLAQRSGYRYRCEHVRGFHWITNSERVRLRYFSQIAEEVEDGKTNRALQHFGNPKQEIEKWFKREVDENGMEKEEEKFKETFEAEYGTIIGEIKNCKSLLDVEKFVTHYLSKVDNITYRMEADRVMIEDNFELFLSIVVKFLEDATNRERFSNLVSHQQPSEDESVLQRLGCTTSCYWCGAICWGQRGHENNKDATSKHHSCHQPQGLVGVHWYWSKELVVRACHQTSDDAPVYAWEFFSDFRPWKEVKQLDRYKDWLYDAHCMDHFNDLMHWFFLKLHKEIAAARGLQPADPKEIREAELEKLKFADILSTIRQKLNNQL